MGILDSIFGRKHSEPEKATARTVEAESQAIPAVMNYERSSLLKYVDKKMPPVFRVGTPMRIYQSLKTRVFGLSPVGGGTAFYFRVIQLYKD